MNRFSLAVKKLWRFQAERYPALFVAATTSLFVITLKHILARHWSFSSSVVPMIGLIAFGVLYLGHIRLLDELRDAYHDRQYYPHRPLPRGLVTEKGLRRSIVVLMICEIFIIAWLNWMYLPQVVILLVFSWLAGHDFFQSSKIRRSFFLYNIIMTSQSFLGLYFIVSIAQRGWLLERHTLLYLIFGYISIVWLEFVRKIRAPHEENASRDTYSSRLGPKGAIVGVGFFLVLLLTPIALMLKQPFGQPFSVISFTLFFCSAIVGGLYIRRLTTRSAKVVQGMGVLTFFILYGTILLLHE